MISGEIYGVIFFLAKKPTFDQCIPDFHNGKGGTNLGMLKLISIQG